MNKKICNYTYIFTKCNHILKFLISHKLNEKIAFQGIPPKATLFSIADFIYGWQKIFMNKNIFSKGDLHVMFITFFSKIYNKKTFIFLWMCPLIDQEHSNRIYPCQSSIAYIWYVSLIQKLFIYDTTSPKFIFHIIGPTKKW